MKGFVTAWRVSRVLPISLVRAIAAVLAAAAWALSLAPVRQLEANLHRVTGLEGAALRRLSRRAMASTARYYAEVMELPRLSGAAIDARVRPVNFEVPRTLLERDGHVVIVLSHSGNWDLTGAYSYRNLAPVTSVAEVLKPREAFDEFVAFRKRLGITILGHEGPSTFRALVKAAETSGGVVALVADRDLSRRGIEVPMWGQTVRVAPGPAALAVETGGAVVPLMVHYERLTGQRRRVARSKWGIVITFGPAIEARTHTGEDPVREMTLAWSSFLADQIALHPEDWHMLQRFGWAS